MRIPLDPHSSQPLYRQIEDYLRQAIRSGSLPPETRLPATRQLAEDLGVSRITVKNAYAELESDGLIASRPGSGTYVSPPLLAPASPDRPADIRWPLWQQDLPAVEAPAIAKPPGRDLNARAHPDPIAFTGVGDPGQFPVRNFLKSIQTVIRRDGVAALEYSGFDGGYDPLRETITQVLASQGIRAQPEHVLVTAGSQQALALACQVLLKSGDAVLVENPTYNFALELFRTRAVKLVGVPIDEAGMQVERVETLLQQHHPRLIYTIPNFQNPSGACLSVERRRQLLALAERYNIPILEDDFVGDLRYDGRALPAIKALDPGGRVIYIGTFSKMLMPGLRVGFLAAEGPVYDHLLRSKLVHDLITSTLMQRTLDDYVTIGRYQTHLRRSVRLYRKRRDAMLEAIRRHLPTGVSFQSPQGGLFIWLELPEDVSALELAPFAEQQGVGYSPGSLFFVEPAQGEGYLRLNFATQDSQRIEEGIRRLGEAMHRLRQAAR
jgi:GntR family transcriptional regulator/MocR family aminotransferase